MNTARSFWLGWGALIAGGAGAYYYAKKDINANRLAKLEEQRRKKQQQIESLEYSDNVPARPFSSSTMAGTDPHPTPSADPPPEKPKYEAAVPFTSRKGDRFS